jgi:hypothetical protein
VRCSYARKTTKAQKSRFSIKVGVDIKGSRLSIDETSLSNGELYTILTNKDAKGKKGAIVAMVEGTTAECIINVITKIPQKERAKVSEITDQFKKLWGC